MNKTRYEYVGGGSSKFYEIEWHSPTQGEATITYGRIGTSGQSITYSMAEARKKEREKIAKGYKQMVVSASAPVQKLGILMMGKPGVGRSFASTQAAQAFKVMTQAAGVWKEVMPAMTINDFGYRDGKKSSGRLDGIPVVAIDQIWERIGGAKGGKYIRIMARGEYEDNISFVYAESDDKRAWVINRKEAGTVWLNKNYKLIGKYNG